MLKKLEAHGYITRARNENDERMVMVSPTESGWELQEKLKDVPATVGCCLGLSKEDAVQLYKILNRMLDNYR